MIVADYWQQQYNNIYSLLNSGDINNFLNWNPITETMFINYDIFTRFWINDIIVNDKWKSLLEKESFKGNPRKSNVYNCSDNQIAQVYHLMSFVNKTNCSLEKIEHIVEFGAGYGLLAKNFFNAGFKGKYHIYDNSVMNIIQKYYLDTNDINYHSDLNFLNDELSNCIFVSNWALSEMPIDLRDTITNSKLFKNSLHYMICFQEWFGGYDNVKYFNNLFKEYELIPYMPLLSTNKNYRIML